jgi:REP element-mobilizing transposase RayT
MARRPRFHRPGGLYHVTLRGNLRSDIFLDDEDHRSFLALLAEGTGRFGYRVHAFCLMTNHVHLALEQGERPLSRGLQNLASRHARRLNERTGRAGHVFQGRYGAFPVESDAYHLELIRYIHCNPVRAGMVARAGDYPYSSHRAYVGRERIDWLVTAPTLAHFDSGRGRKEDAFDRFVAAAPDPRVRDVLYRRPPRIATGGQTPGSDPSVVALGSDPTRRDPAGRTPA